MSFWWTIPLSILITGIVALLVSFPILKLKDDSLMLISFGFALIMFNVMLNWAELTNGALGVKGIPPVDLFDINFISRPNMLILMLVVLSLVFFFFHKVIRSPYGTVIQGIRENVDIMKNMGHNSKWYQHSVFIVGAIVAGIAGSFFATYFTFIEPSFFTLLPSLLLLVIVIFGGFGNIWGSLLGAIILVLFPEFLRFIGLPDSIMAETQQILYGLLLFLLMYFRPQGLIGRYTT